MKLTLGYRWKQKKVIFTTKNIYIVSMGKELLNVINSVFINAILCPCYGRSPPPIYDSVFSVCY